MHAGPIDTGFGPRHANHVSADELARLAAPTEDARGVLSALGIGVTGPRGSGAG